MAASSSEVVKRILRFKPQLTDSAQPATVLKILQKLKDLDITVDILAETGIGKTVNSLRRHEEAGEFAKSLVSGWKKLVPKQSTSHTEGGNVLDSVSKDKPGPQNCPNNGMTAGELNNNCSTSCGKSQETSSEHFFKQILTEKQREDQKRKRDQKGKRNQRQEDELEASTVSKRKKKIRNDRSGESDEELGSKTSEDTHERSRPEPKGKPNSHGVFHPEKDSSKKKSKPSKEPSQDRKEISLFESKHSKKVLKLGSPGSTRSSEPQNTQRKREKEKHSGLRHKDKSEYKEHSEPQNKKAKIKHRHVESDTGEPSMSFESYLNYDEQVPRRKERSVLRKIHQKAKTVVKEAPGKDAVKSPETCAGVLSPKKLFSESILDQIDIPLSAVLSECEQKYFEKKAEKECDFFDVTEESTVFTGQRLNKKMQVYSGTKTVFLPSMMSLYQQCIRTLQNNINLLHETGGVPFEILEPVLARCTPEQLLRIEECNPVYIGATDHLWGKHCQRDFKNSKLQEYESWKEMYIRLSEERERKFQRLTKSIVSAHSRKPKGRQVKMAFIHTVAKPPRDVRIQQEIHGTAVQQPQLRCSVKIQDTKSRPNNESSRSCSSSSSISGSISSISISSSISSSSSSSGTSNTQDPRKKTRVAPMMAKSLKAFKKQLGRR